ncbi:hypothetical protein DFJ58DRAFT_915440, partial [Suillus subalutaceus]|uniref:uncharacterized protein n=1 Tax=Suillus subalutaceus TaxID=48586 RepID=UPI001B8702D3
MMNSTSIFTYRLCKGDGGNSLINLSDQRGKQVVKGRPSRQLNLPWVWSTGSPEGLENDDLLPVEPEKRTWHAYNYVAFRIADMFNINMWMIVRSASMRLSDNYECLGGKPGYAYDWVR